MTWMLIAVGFLACLATALLAVLALRAIPSAFRHGGAASIRPLAAFLLACFGAITACGLAAGAAVGLVAVHRQQQQTQAEQVMEAATAAEQTAVNTYGSPVVSAAKLEIASEPLADLVLESHAHLQLEASALTDTVIVLVSVGGESAAGSVRVLNGSALQT